MQTHTDSAMAPDGCPRFFYQWLPDDGEVRAALHISHGMAEHGGRYARLAAALTPLGWAVSAHDHRGHGQTTLQGPNRGLLAEDDGWALVVQDLRDMLDRTHAAWPGRPVFLLGHSMGSLIAQSLMTQGDDSVGDLAGVVLSGTNGKPPAIATVGRLIARLERLRLGKRGRSPILHALTFADFNKQFAPTRTDFDWLSRDPAEVDAYIADPDCGFQCGVQTWIDLLDAIAVSTTDDAQLRIPAALPVYLVAGDQDPVGEKGKSVAALASDLSRAGVKDVTLKLWEGARHEIINETNRDDVTKGIVDWLEARVPPA